jgi:integrase
MVDLRGRPALAARCLELTTLCCTRSGEAFGAHVREFDLARKEWTIPAERMKAGAPHTIPLVGRALEIVRELLPLTSGYLFPSPGSKAGHLSNMAMEMLLRRMGVQRYTVHGMRSAFRDWAGDCTEHPEEIAEMALAHTVGSAVRRAYRRSEALAKRRALMVDWDAFAMGGAAA